MKAPIFPLQSNAPVARRHDHAALSLLTPLSAIAALALSSCANFSENTNYTGDNPTGHGPFASNGDYREDLADSPEKWKSGLFSRSKAPLPIPEEEQAKIAGNDHPPDQLSPLSPSVADATPSVDTEVARVRPSSSASNEKAKSTISANAKPTSAVKNSAKSTAKTSPKAPSTVAKEVTPATSKPKSKTASTSTVKGPKRVVVKKGDTLYDLAITYKSSVAAIQKANGISGSNLRIGQSLIIPRY